MDHEIKKEEKFEKVDSEGWSDLDYRSPFTLFSSQHHTIYTIGSIPSVPTMEVTATATADTDTNSPNSRSSTIDDFALFPIYAAEAMNPSRRSTMEDCYSILRPGTWNETIPDLSKSILEGIVS